MGKIRNIELRDVVVICTRNRAADIKICMKSLAQQRRLPAQILVVDSSDDNATEKLLENMREVNKHLNIEYIHTVPGLTLQRNAALDIIHRSFDVVHFIDDDVELEPEYIQELMRVFENDQELIGAGGHIIGWWNGKQPSALMVVAGLDSRRPGSVTAAGYNVGPREANKSHAVEWLSGCSMSYRLASIAGLRFDENRTGYAIGEDVDFGLKAKQRGKLLFVNNARLLHHQSPTNRHKRPQLARMAVLHRWDLAVNELGDVKKVSVIIGSLSQACLYFIKYFRARPWDSVWMRCSASTLAGLIDIALSDDAKRSALKSTQR